jgi:hypothetical protein
MICLFVVEIFLCVQNLELEYIYGYRGFDARSNLYYVNDGSDIIFHAAGAGIVQNLGSGKHALSCC